MGFKKIIVACMSLTGKTNDSANFNLNLKNSPRRALKKKKMKFSSTKNLRKFGWGRLQNHIQYEGGLPYIQYEKMRNEEAVSHL